MLKFRSLKIMANYCLSNAMPNNWIRFLWTCSLTRLMLWRNIKLNRNFRLFQSRLLEQIGKRQPQKQRVSQRLAGLKSKSIVLEAIPSRFTSSITEWGFLKRCDRASSIPSSPLNPLAKGQDSAYPSATKSLPKSTTGQSTVSLYRITGLSSWLRFSSIKQ